jgi:hypothetical protein
MPIPSRKNNESTKEFMSRCMSDSTMNKEYNDEGQRYAICLNQSKASLIEKVCSNLPLDYEYIDYNNIYIPEDNEYIECDEETEIVDLSSIAAYQYKDMKTGQIYIFDMRGNHTRDGRVLVYIGRASEYQGKKVTLNKPFRTPDGPKKFSVYVKNEKGNVVKVNFGDPNMKIKKNIPERRKSFRARHKCDQKKDKTTPAYWSCKMW